MYFCPTRSVLPRIQLLACLYKQQCHFPNCNVGDLYYIFHAFWQHWTKIQHRNVLFSDLFSLWKNVVRSLLAPGLEDLEVYADARGLVDCQWLFGTPKEVIKLLQSRDLSVAGSDIRRKELLRLPDFVKAVSSRTDAFVALTACSTFISSNDKAREFDALWWYSSPDQFCVGVVELKGKKASSATLWKSSLHSKLQDFGLPNFPLEFSFSKCGALYFRLSKSVMMQQDDEVVGQLEENVPTE